MCVTFHDRPPNSSTRGPSTASVSREAASTDPILLRPASTVNSGAAVKTASSSMKMAPAEVLLGLDSAERASRVLREEAFGQHVFHDLWGGLIEARQRPHPFTSPPAAPGGSATLRQGSVDVPRLRCRYDGLDPSGRPHCSMPRASSTASSMMHRNRQLRLVPGRRPVGPRRCRNDETVGVR